MVDTTAKELLVPGAVLLLRTPQGEFKVTYGTTQLGTTSPPRADTHFRIASNTKSMTAAVIVQLAQEGKLSLDDPVSKYVAGVPNGDNITIDELLTMRSGLYNYTDVPELAATVAHGISVGSWNTKPMPRMPATVAASSRDHAIFPLVGSLKPAMMRSSVDLPQPDGPSSDTNSPGRTSRLKRSSATTPLAKVLPTLSRATTVAPDVDGGAAESAGTLQYRMVGGSRADVTIDCMMDKIASPRRCRGGGARAAALVPHDDPGETLSMAVVLR